jgi:hypothetical protein
MLEKRIACPLLQKNTASDINEGFVAFNDPVPSLAFQMPGPYFLIF